MAAVAVVSVANDNDTDNVAIIADIYYTATFAFGKYIACILECIVCCLLALMMENDNNIDNDNDEEEMEEMEEEL